jgi:hypothetical protein
MRKVFPWVVNCRLRIPAVATYAVLRGTLEVGGKLNDVVALSQPLTSRHDFLTVNDVTPYAISSLSTADGPNCQVR